MDKAKLEALASVPPESLLGRTRYLNNFIYGEFGVGKTILACRCVRNKGLIIHTDSGTDSIYNHPELLDKIDVVPYSGLTQLTAIGEAITEGIEPWSLYDTVIVDTASQIQEEYLDWLNENFKFAGSYREKAVPRNPRSGLSEQEIIGLPDYHLARNNMRHPIKTLVKAPVDVWFLAHLREPSFLEQQKGKLVRRPTMTEKVFQLIARETSLLGLMERNGSKRTVQFTTDKKTVCKSRIKELDNQTLTDNEVVELLNKWRMN